MVLKMSKRFTWKTEKLQHSDDEVLLVVDNENKEWKGHILNIVDLLNELAEENEQLEKGKMEALSLLGEEIDKNEQLKNYFKKRAECSNFQINKLKEEIAELQEDNVDTIVELSKENEKLRKELGDCEKFRYQVFKRMNDEYIKECSIK